MKEHIREYVAARHVSQGSEPYYEVWDVGRRGTVCDWPPSAPEERVCTKSLTLPELRGVCERLNAHIARVCGFNIWDGPLLLAGSLLNPRESVEQKEESYRRCLANRPRWEDNWDDFWLHHGFAPLFDPQIADWVLGYCGKRLVEIQALMVQNTLNKKERQRWWASARRLLQEVASHDR